MSSIINAILYREPTVSSMETQTEPTSSDNACLINKSTLWRVAVSYLYEPIDCCGRGTGDRYVTKYAVIYASSAAEAKCHFVASNTYEKGFIVEVEPYNLGDWLDDENMF